MFKAEKKSRNQELDLVARAVLVDFMKHKTKRVWLLSVMSHRAIWRDCNAIFCARFEILKGHRPSRLRFFVLVLVPGSKYRDGAANIPLQNLYSHSLITYHVTGSHTLFDSAGVVKYPSQ